MKYKTKKDELTLKHMPVYPITKFPTLKKPLSMACLAKKHGIKPQTVNVKIKGDW